MTKKIFYILLFFLSLTNLSIAQYIPLDEQKAKLIWEIQKYLAWPNDASLDKIYLGTYQCPKNILDAINKYKPSRFSTGIDYKVINFQTLDQVKQYGKLCQMFYIPAEHNDVTRQIMDILAPYPILIITDEWYDKQKIMINLFVETSGEKVNFEYNTENISNQGISIIDHKAFEQLNGIDLNAKKLLQQTRKELQKVEQNLKAKEQELQQKLKEVEVQKKKIQEQNIYIKQQEQIIAQRQQEIAKQKAKLQQLYSKLMTYQAQLQEQIKTLQEKEAEIQKSQKQLALFRQKVQREQALYKKQAKLLAQQKQRMKEIEREVAAKQKELANLTWQVNAQRLVIAVFLVLLIIIGILSYFIYKSYKIQKQQNIILQQQKEQIERQAEELEKLSIVASETSNAVAILNVDGSFEWVNKGYTKLYGYTLQMLKNFYDNNIINFNPLLNTAIKECIELKNSIDRDVKIKTRNGKYIWVHSTITPIVNEDKVVKIIIIDSDITQIKEAEEEIRRKNEQILKQAQELERKNFELAKLSTVVELTDNGVIIADNTGKIEWVNKGFERMLDMTFDEFKQYYGNNIIFANLDTYTLNYIENALKNKESAEYTLKLQTPKGKIIWLRSTLTPMFDKNSGKLLKIFSVNADITEIKLAQEKIEKQNHDIKQSIYYARRIQQAALPPKNFIDSLLPENFILYMPRDIVSGDFYWASHIRDKILIAAADCTGHGVPGAFMSMLGIAFLNEIVAKFDYDILEPNLILNTLRDYVIRFLKQEESSHSTKDGMDIALCMIDQRTGELHFAGANNPLWIVRNEDFIEFKGDDMPIGIYYNISDSFTNHIFHTQHGDTLYIFSDGYADQFGGPRGKKFMTRRFRQLVIEIANLPMEKQKEILLQRHLEWKGERKQLDDILVIGFRV